MGNAFLYEVYGTTLITNVPLPGYDICSGIKCAEDGIRLFWNESSSGITPSKEEPIGFNGFIKCYQMRQGKLLCAPGISIVVTRSGIEVFAASERLREALLICVNTGIVLCLYMRGYLVLHASAAWCEDGLYAFTSESGTGKSTLCFFLSVTKRMSFFSDDIVPILIEEGSVYAYPLNAGNSKAGISITQKVYFDESTCTGMSYAYDDVEFYYHLRPSIKQKSRRRLRCLCVLELGQSERTSIARYENSIPARILTACHSIWALNKKERAVLIVRSRKVAELIEVSTLKYERSYEKLSEVGDMLLQHMQGIR